LGHWGGGGGIVGFGGAGAMRGVLEADGVVAGMDAKGRWGCMWARPLGV